MPILNRLPPGRIVRLEFLAPRPLSVIDAATAPGTSRVAVSELMNQRRAISPEIVIRLAKAADSSAAGPCRCLDHAWANR